MPITADKLKKMGIKWVLNNVRFEVNQGFTALVGTFRELGMTDREIRQIVAKALRERTKIMLEDAFSNATVPPN